MQKLGNIFNNLLLCLVFLVVLTLPAIIPLTRPGFFPSQDEVYMVRMYEMDKAIKDGQFPVRWAPDLRYGEPLFNFYAPLPYYVASLIHTFNISFINTSKILLALGFFLSGVAMFFLSREFFKNIGGLISATLYIYAPYHAVDVYVRGALSESLTLVLFPLIFLISLKLSQKPTINKLLLLSLSLAALFYTHNIMTLLFFPFLIGWIIFLVWQAKKIGPIKYFLFSGALAIGLAASFLLPAFFEKGFTQSDGMVRGYYDYRNHFVAIGQFVSTFWGYGASSWALEDEMSFQVGLAQLGILALSFIVAVLYKKDSKIFFLVMFLGLEFLFSLFMQHNKSTPIWTSLPILAYTQFPWRFLGISIFLLSFAGGLVGLFLKRNFVLIAFVIIAVTIVTNINYFQPKFYKPSVIDENYINLPAMFSGDNLPKDYLPVWVKSITSEKLTTPRVLEGKANISDFKKDASSAKFRLQAFTDVEIEVPVSYFPNWQVFFGEELIPQESPSELGLIRFRIPTGNYLINLKFSDTPIRTAANLVSLFSLMVVVFLVFRNKIITRFEFQARNVTQTIIKFKEGFLSRND